MNNISLNGIELPGLVIPGDIRPGAVRAVVSETISGGKVVWEQPVASGGSIDLVGGSDYGWLTRGTLQTLAGLANVVGASYTLTLADGSTKTVRFRNEDTAIEAEPIVPRPNPASTDQYNNITIRLMEV